MKTLHLMRHGQTVANRDKLVSGYYNTGLTARGKSDARDAIPKLSTLDIEHIYTSPLLRTRKTANIVSESIHLIPHIKPLLIEKDM